MKARVKTDNLAYNSEIATELIDLTAQVGNAIGQRGGIVGVRSVQKVIDCGLDECGFCHPAALGGG